MTSARFWIRLITQPGSDALEAIEQLDAIVAETCGVEASAASREPYDKLGLYSEALVVNVDAPAPTLLHLYNALRQLAPTGWVEEVRQFETLREAYWDARRTDETLLAASVAWAHMNLTDE